MMPKGNKMRMIILIVVKAQTSLFIGTGFPAETGRGGSSPATRSRCVRDAIIGSILFVFYKGVMHYAVQNV